MAWRCAECGEPETDKTKIDVACHHCGKPLCEEDRITLSGDVFSEADGPIDELAHHCSDCYRAHHVPTSHSGNRE